MKGDFSRSSFDPQKHYRGVRMQQGRVQLDADWNEQVDILLHLIGTQLYDLLGPGATAVTKPGLNDLPGPGAAAVPKLGFAITLDQPAQEPADKVRADETEGPTASPRNLPDFKIGAGRYYVDGILCENEAAVQFSRQPDYPDAQSLLQRPVDVDRFLVYIDVWQRHITALQDPAIREIALGGPDTATRVKTVWQVELLPLPGGRPDDQGRRDCGGLRSLPEWEAFVAQASQKGLLKARWDRSKGAVLENHLYRVEIHTVAGDQVTFKWSRENGSVVFPMRGLEAFTWEDMPESVNEHLMGFLRREGLALDWVKDAKISKSADGRTVHIEKDRDWVKIELDEEEKTATLTTSREERRLLTVTEENGKRKLYSMALLTVDGKIELNLEDLDRDPHQFQPGFWVELVDDITVLNGQSLPLCQVKELDRPNARVTLSAEQHEIGQILAEIGAREPHHPLLRRWEDDAKLITPELATTATQGETWLDLENGIQVAFSGTGTYRVGDYWLIPARTRSKDGIDWPQKDSQPVAQAPHGIAHHYAPLGLLQFQDGHWSVHTEDCSAFHSLPQITADLSATEEQLKAVLLSLDQVQKTVDASATEEQLKAALLSLDQVRKTVDALVEQTHVFEIVKSDESLEKGDLVSLDHAAVERIAATDPGTELPVKLASSKKRHGQLVVGVVTELMEDQRCRVALYGRVRCKVRGCVEPGDLLVPSSEPGHVQKRGWPLRMGTIVGKALSSPTFDEGKQTGTLDMLVTLG